MQTEEFSNLKVAIVHNWLWKRRGAERVLEEMCKLFPKADIFALFGDSRYPDKYLQGHRVRYSWLQKLPFIKFLYKATLPLWPTVIEQLDLSGYDLVISSSAAVAKGVISPLRTTHICYLYTPMRYIWDQTWDYFESYSAIRKILLAPVLTYLRIWDQSSAGRPDLLISISKFVDKRVRKYYQRRSDSVIYPPTEITPVSGETSKGDYYLALSPFEENKGGERIVKAAVNLGVSVKITGDGILRKNCEKIARGHENVQFLGWVSEERKKKLLRGAKGLLFLGEEDFGLTAVEAIAMGTPVLAYNSASASEIVKDGVNGVLIDDRSEASIKAGLDRLSRLDYNSENMYATVEKFSKEHFVSQFMQIVRDAVEDKRTILNQEK